MLYIILYESRIWFSVNFDILIYFMILDNRNILEL